MDQAIENAKARLKVLCEEIGLSETEVEGRYRELEYAVDNALSLYVGVVLEEIDGLRDRCTSLHAEIEKMQKELSDVDFEANLGEIKPPYKVLCQNLEATKTKLLGWHAQRSKRAAAASERITELEAILQQPQTVLPTDLSQSSICKMEARVAELTRLRDARVAEMHKLASEAQDLWDALGTDADRNEALKTLTENYQTAPEPWLGADGTRGLWDAVEGLRKEKERRQQQVAALAKELNFLYEMLDIPETERDVGLNETSLTAERVEALQAELARLQQAKAAHMSKFIDRAKTRLEELWEKMYFAPEETAKFAPYNSTEVTEQILQALHDEISRIEDLVRDPERLHLYALVHRLKMLQSRELELERLEQDPSRFNRRGKERLEEQRMRSSVAKKPQVVVELKTCLEKWQESHEPFLIYGKPVLDEVMAEESKLLYRRPRARGLQPAAKPQEVPGGSAGPRPRAAAGRVEKSTARRLPNPGINPAPAVLRQRNPSASRRPNPLAAAARPQLTSTLRHNEVKPSAAKLSTRRSTMMADSSFEDPQMELWRANRERDRTLRSRGR